MTEHRRDTWAARRKFNPEAAAPPDLQPKPKRRHRSKGKRAQFMAVIVEELLEYRKATDQAAAAVLSQNKPTSTQKPTY